ncbi:MAG: rhomboid family intramembrane serine protease [Akkermansiaceae bacterium]
MASSTGRVGRGCRQLIRSHLSWGLVAVLVIVQLIPMVWAFASNQDKSLVLSNAQASFGLNRTAFFSGSFWQVLSYALLHGNWLHLAFNAAAILLLGSKLEHIISRRSYLLLFLYAILAGAIAFLLLCSRHENHTLVGASSVCFAFLVLLTTLSPDSRFLPVFLSGKTVGLGIILTTLLLALMNPSLPTGPLAAAGEYLSNQGVADLFKISHACHFGGAVTGWIYGKYLLRPRVTLESLRLAREKSEQSAKPPSPN